MARTTLVLPCYDEADRLDPDVFAVFVRKHEDVDLLFVDDGSRDATPALLERLREGSAGRIEVLVLPRNGGKAEAVRRGIRRVLERGTSDYVGYWDADLATPLEAVREMVRILDRNPRIELVLASRVKLMGRRIERRPLRHYLGRICATAVSLTLRLPVYDTQCGAKLLRAGPALAPLFEEPFRTRWIFDVELIARLVRLRAASGEPFATDVIVEHPLHEWRDVGGSKVRLRDYLVGASDLAWIWWHYLRPLGHDRSQG